MPVKVPKPKIQPYSFKEIKEYLQAQHKIRFKNHATYDSGLQSLLENFFNINCKSHTVFADTGEIQTSADSRRSIGDIYRIIWFYYPKVTLTTVYSAVLDRIVEGNAYSSICKQTGLRVYRKLAGYSTAFMNGERVDEYGVDITQFPQSEDIPVSEGNWGIDFTRDNLKMIKIK